MRKKKGKREKEKGGGESERGRGKHEKKGRRRARRREKTSFVLGHGLLPHAGTTLLDFPASRTTSQANSHASQMPQPVALSYNIGKYIKSSFT